MTETTDTAPAGEKPVIAPIDARAVDVQEALGQIVSLAYAIDGAADGLPAMHGHHRHLLGHIVNFADTIETIAKRAADVAESIELDAMRARREAA